MSKPKKESSRTNTGVRGGPKTKLTSQQKILMGGGALRNINKPSKKLD